MAVQLVLKNLGASQEALLQPKLASGPGTDLRAGHRPQSLGVGPGAGGAVEKSANPRPDLPAFPGSNESLVFHIKM